MPTFVETMQALAADASTTRNRAIARALAIQKEIERLRGDLQGVADNRTLSDLRRAGPAAVDAATILLASYDAELTRLCQIPGVLSALLAEMVIEEPTE